jgi:hypothetical protein
VPGEDFEFPKRFTAELERFDIGLILMWKDKKTWNFQVLEWETDRLSPAPAELNGLLQTFFQQSKRKREFMHLVVIFLLGLVLYNVWHVNVRQPAQGTGPTTIALQSLRIQPKRWNGK